MSCQIKSEEHSDLLLAYSAGRLRDEDVARLELHMKSCPDCAAIGKAHSAVWNLLDAWEAPPVSADFDRVLYARIEASASAPWLDRWLDHTSAAVCDFFRPVFAQPAFALAAATLVVVGGFVLDHPAGKLTSVNNRAQIQVSSMGSASKVEVDQVEATLDDIEMLHQFDARSDEKESSSKSM
jgi:anti-sigma factor RsiW